MKSPRLDPAYLSQMAAEGIKLQPQEGAIEPGVVDLVVALNRFGIKTESSCDGHGQGGVCVTFFADENSEDAEARIREVLQRSGDQWTLEGRSNTYRFPRKKFPTVKFELTLRGPVQDAFPAARRLATALSS